MDVAASPSVPVHGIEQQAQCANATRPASLHNAALRTAFFSSTLCEDGHCVPSHPESYERAQVVRTRITRDFPDIHHVQHIAPATRQRLLLFHTPKHIDRLDALFAKVRGATNSSDMHSGAATTADVVHRIDEDTAVTRGTEAAALAAAGAVCDAIDLVMRGVVTNAFCGVRPPGHHAEPQRAMGFCLFNNVGIGACYVLDAYPKDVQRVAILDFDVHHGNGTQAKFINASDARVQYISTHQAPFYPHTGKASERGAHDNVRNVPLPAHTDSRSFRAAVTLRVLPALRAFAPDVVLVSAGFDAHVLDPLAELALTSDDYYWVTQQVVAVAWTSARGRVVSVLEGGYHLEALADSAAAHVRALVDGSLPPHASAHQRDDPDSSAVDALADAFDASLTLAPHANTEINHELRLTVHYGTKAKLVLLPTRSLDALFVQCKRKLSVKVAAAPPTGKAAAKGAKTLVDRHGALLTADALLALPHDQHVYVR